MQEVEMPDGRIIEFPIGTSRDVINRVSEDYVRGMAAAGRGEMPAQAGPRVPGAIEEAPALSPAPAPTAPAADITAGLESLGGMRPMGAPAPAAGPMGVPAPAAGPVGTPAGEPQGGLNVTARDLGVDLQPVSSRAGKLDGEVSWQEGYLRSLIDEGLFLGAGDEMAAAVMATMEAPFSDRSWSEIYESALAEERGRLEAAPFSARLVGNLAGMAIPGSGAFQASRVATTLPRRIGALTGTGAAFGGTAGFLAGEGGLESRLESAAPAAVLGAVTAPAMAGATTLGGRLLQRFNLGDPERWSYDKLRQALLRSGLNPRQAERRLQDMGPEAIVADLTEDTRRKFGDVFRAPGTTRERAFAFLEGRQADQGERVIAETRRLLGENRKFGEVMDEIGKRQREMAVPLYEQAFQAPVEITNELRDLLGRPTFKKAALKAQQLAADEGRDIPKIIFEDEAGKLELVANPDMETFDWIKRALDDRIGYLMRNERADEARIIIGAKNKMLEILDDQVPVYKSARAVWEGEEKAKETLVAGQKYMRGLFEDKVREMQQIPPGKKDLYRLGALTEIEDKLYRAPEGGDKVKNLFGSPEKQRRMRQLFPDQASYDAFARRMQVEADFSKTFAQGRGSPTAERLQEADDTATNIAISLLDHNSLQAMFMDLLRRGVISDAQRGALGELFMRRGPEALQTMKQLARGLPQRTTRQYLESHFGKGLGGLSMAAGPVAAPILMDDTDDPEITVGP